MRVFVTGATGWIGSAAVERLLAAGHEVVGLARSAGAQAVLAARGVTPLPGDLNDVDGLATAAAAADGVIHLGFNHDFGDHEGAWRTERAAVGAMLDALAGSDRPFLLASGVAIPVGRTLTELDPSPFVGPDAMRGGSERLALDAADRGIRSVSLRFAPSVHGTGDHGFVATLVDVARRRGVAAYVGDGANRWPAVHRDDAADLVVRALEGAEAGTAVHAVAEEGVAGRDIAGAIGAQLGLPVASVAPEQAADHFGWIGRFFALDVPASNAITRERFGWTPTGPTLLEDVASGAYTAA